MKGLAKAALLPLLCGCLFAHAGRPVEPHDLASAWEFDPGVVIPLVFTAALYALGSRKPFGQTRLQKHLLLVRMAFSLHSARFPAPSPRRSTLLRTHGPA